MRTVAILGLLVVTACFDPTFHDPTCGSSGSCPPGWTCAAGIGAACTLAPIPDAAIGGGSDGDVDAGGCATWQDVLANGNFEGGHTAWVEGPATDKEICNKSQLTLSTKDGDWCACFGLNNNHSQVMTQTVTLPAGTSRVRLHGYRCLVSSDTTSPPTDVMHLQLTATNDDTQVLATLGSWTNLDAKSDCQWVWFELIADVASAPAQASMRLQSSTDGNHVTSWYLDGLGLQAFAPSPCSSSIAGAPP
jgi:hypothetical protein